MCVATLKFSVWFYFQLSKPSKLSLFLPKRLRVHWSTWTADFSSILQKSTHRETPLQKEGLFWVKIRVRHLVVMVGVGLEGQGTDVCASLYTPSLVSTVMGIPGSLSLMKGPPSSEPSPSRASRTFLAHTKPWTNFLSSYRVTQTANTHIHKTQIN